MLSYETELNTWGINRNASHLFHNAGYQVNRRCQVDSRQKLARITCVFTVFFLLFCARTFVWGHGQTRVKESLPALTCHTPEGEGRMRWAPLKSDTLCVCSFTGIVCVSVDRSAPFRYRSFSIILLLELLEEVSKLSGHHLTFAHCIAETRVTAWCLRV